MYMGTKIASYKNNPPESGGGVTALLEDGRQLHADADWGRRNLESGSRSNVW